MAERMSDDSEDSDLAVTVVTSRLPPALTLSNECSREQSEREKKLEIERVSRQTVAS